MIDQPLIKTTALELTPSPGMAITFRKPTKKLYGS